MCCVWEKVICASPAKNLINWLCNTCLDASICLLRKDTCTTEAQKLWNMFIYPSMPECVQNKHKNSRKKDSMTVVTLAMNSVAVKLSQWPGLITGHAPLHIFVTEENRLNAEDEYDGGGWTSFSLTTRTPETTTSSRSTNIMPRHSNTARKEKS